jgi:hypothetical protein
MFIVKTISTKPAGVHWRAPEVISGTTQTLGQWTLAQDGVVSTKTRKAGKHKLVNVSVFRDQAAYDAYVAARDTNTEFIARTEYNTANNITSIVKKLQVVA